MTKNLKILAGAAMILLTSGATNASGFCFKPYVGADAQFRFMSFQRDFGSKNFRNRYPQANVYVGLKFCDYLGLEGGYFSSADLTRQSFFQTNELSLGANTFADTTSIGSSRIAGWHINAVGFVPVSECYHLSALVYIGISQCKINLRDITTSIGGLPDNLTVNFSQTKNILRLGAGLEHMITDCIGVRSLISFENTSAFKNIRNGVSPEGAAPAGLVKVNNSVVLSFGIFARL